MKRARWAVVGVIALLGGCRCGATSPLDGGGGGSDTGAPGDAGPGSDAASDSGPPVLTCDNPDITAPIIIAASPSDGDIGVNPATAIALVVGDGCGVDPATVTLSVDGVPVTPTLGGDPMATTIDFAPPAMFLLDAVVTLGLHAADSAGNALDATLRFRVWDEFIDYAEAATGIDAATPDTVLAVAEGYPVFTGAGGAAGRMVMRFPLAGYPAGTAVVSAQLGLCSNETPAATTAVTCYALARPFAAAEVTWNAAAAATPWDVPGADGVPGDRAAASFGVVSLLGGLPPYSTSFADVSAQAQAWLDGAAPNDGAVCAGDAGGVAILGLASNCPPTIGGLIGRPLP
jgi:hypothetical protein